MSKELTTKDQDAADMILRETRDHTRLLQFKKGKYFCGDDEVEAGHEYIAFPLDMMRGGILFVDGIPVEQRIGRVAAGFRLNVEELGDGWQRQILLPLEDTETGEVLAFVSTSTGGEIAVEELSRRVAHDVKKGSVAAGTPLIRLAVGSFPTKE